MPKAVLWEVSRNSLGVGVRTGEGKRQERRETGPSEEDGGEKGKTEGRFGKGGEEKSHPHGHF